MKTPDAKFDISRFRRVNLYEDYWRYSFQSNSANSIISDAQNEMCKYLSWRIYKQNRSFESVISSILGIPYGY